ncbi:MAG: hypothetical protein EZS28_007930, partial [Streblomastix strix]
QSSGARVRISNIPNLDDAKQVTAIAEQYGTIRGFQYYPGQDGQPGYAIVEYESSDYAEAAIHSAPEKRKLDGVELKIKFDQVEQRRSHSPPPISQTSPPLSQSLNSQQLVSQIQSSLTVPYPPSVGQSTLQPTLPNTQTGTSVLITNILNDIDEKLLFEKLAEFGKIKKIYYEPYLERQEISSKEEYEISAIVEYETHEAAQSIYDSNPRKRIVEGVILQSIPGEYQSSGTECLLLDKILIKLSELEKSKVNNRIPGVISLMESLNTTQVVNAIVARFTELQVQNQFYSIHIQIFEVIIGLFERLDNISVLSCSDV